PLDEPEVMLRPSLAKLLGLPAGDPWHYRILRKALDARDARALTFVYTVEVAGGDDDALLARTAKRSRPVRVERYHEESFVMPPAGSAPLPHRPIVVGSGPGGLAAAYFLAEQGYRPLLLERGRRVSDRIRDVRAFDVGGPHDPESNYLFGEGGAGTFSD